MALIINTYRDHQIDMQNQGKPIFDSSSLQQKIYLTIFKLTKLRCCQTFLQPVDPNIFHGYHQIIIKPMCLKEIIRKLKSSQYRYMQDVYEDLLLISKNCFLYHRGKPNQEQVKKIISRYIRSMDNAWLGLKKQMKDAGIDEYKRINHSEIQKKIQNIEQKIKKTMLKRMERIKQLGLSQNQQHKIQQVKKIQPHQQKEVVLQRQLSSQQQIDDKKISKINQEKCISILKNKLTVDQKSDSKLLNKEIISQRSRSSRLRSQTNEKMIIQQKQEQPNLTSSNEKFIKIRRSCRLDNKIIKNKSEQKQKEVVQFKPKSQRINNIRKQSTREQSQTQKHILSYKKLRQWSVDNQSNENQQQKTQTIILPVFLRKNKQRQNNRDKSKQKINNLSKRKSKQCQHNQDGQMDKKQIKSSQKQTIINTKNIQHDICTETIVQIVPNIQRYRPTIVIKAQARQQYQQCISQKLCNANQQQKSPSQSYSQNFNDKQQSNQPIQDSQQQQLQNSQQIEQKMNKIIKHKLRKYKTLLINFITWIYDKIIKLESKNKCHQANIRDKNNAQKQIQQTENQCKYCQQCQLYKQQCKMYEKLKNMQSYKYLQQFLRSQLQNLQKGQINLKKLLKMLKQFNLWIKLVSGPYIQWRIKQNYLEIQRNIIKCLQKIIQYKKLGPQFSKIVQQTKRQNQKQTYQLNQQQNRRITRSKIKTSNPINYRELFASCQENKHKQIKQLNLANKYNITTLKGNNNLKDNKNSDDKQILGDVQDNYKNDKGHDEFMRLLELDQIYNSFKIVIEKDKNVNDPSKLKIFDKNQQMKKRRIRRNPIQKQKHISQNSFYGPQQQQQYTPPPPKLQSNTPKTPRIRKLNKIHQQYQQQQQNRTRMRQTIEQDEQFLFQYSLRSNQAILCKYQRRLQLNWNMKMDLLFGAVPQAIKFDNQSTGLENKEQLFL